MVVLKASRCGIRWAELSEQHAALCAATNEVVLPGTPLRAAACVMAGLAMGRNVILK